jgi:hypothetical protein
MNYTHDGSSTGKNTLSRPAFACKHDRDGQDHQLEVVYQRLRLKVIDVLVNHLLEGHPAASKYLPSTRQAGFASQA